MTDPAKDVVERLEATIVRLRKSAHCLAIGGMTEHLAVQDMNDEAANLERHILPRLRASVVEHRGDDGAGDYRKRSPVFRAWRWLGQPESEWPAWIDGLEPMLRNGLDHGWTFIDQSPYRARAVPPGDFEREFERIPSPAPSQSQFESARERCAKEIKTAADDTIRAFIVLVPEAEQHMTLEQFAKAMDEIIERVRSLQEKAG